MKLLQKSLLLTAFVCIRPALLFSQTFPGEGSHSIKISPMRLADMANPGLELSYEKFHGLKYSFQASVGFMNEFINTTPYRNYKGFRLSLEEKLFLNEVLNGQHYLSAELAILKVNYTDEASFTKSSPSPATEYVDTFSVNKTHFSLNFRKGHQMYFGKIVLDLSLGLGVKYKMVKRTGISDANAIEVRPLHPNIYRISSAEGNYFTLNIPLAVRIGFTF